MDTQILEQLKQLFQTLDNDIQLCYQPSFHNDQDEMIELLNSVASTSPKIHVKLLAAEDGKTAPFPQLHIQKNGQPTGIGFKGIPSGHEFSSLVLAIMNADQKGRLPDPALISRIKRLKGPVNLRTFVSLTCENCPDVVQALNQMAVLHGYFKHEMIDGGYAQDEVESLKIGGVPSVFAGDTMISSGRISLLDLLKKLEDHFGVTEGAQASPEDMDLGHFDVVVVGGGPAGASAAIYSVRKGLKTALLSDKFGGQVQDTRGIENLISVPYTEGPQLAQSLNQHVQSYPIKVFEHRKVKSILQPKDTTKKIELESGETLLADQIILATGAKWRELKVPGEKEYLGRGVAFCPHCDGPFYKGKKIAVVGGGNSGVEAAIDLAGIVGQVVLIEYNDKLKADQILVNKLMSLANVSVITNARTQQILGDGQKVNGLEYLDRQTEKLQQIPLDGVFIQIGLVPNSQFLKGVIELSPYGEVIVDHKGHTSAPGIYAAGDVTTTPYKQIIIAMGEGAKAALAAFEDRMLR